MPSDQDPIFAETVDPDRDSIATEGDRRTVRGAIELVASGIAVRVLLADLESPDAVVAGLQPEAETAGALLQLGDSSNHHVVVGPRRT